MNELTNTSQQDVDKTPKKYKYKAKSKKHQMFMELYTNPQLKTFGNVYQSGINAGFSPSYSRNITYFAPSWLSEYMEKVELHPEHIKQGVQSIATGKIDSKSVDDTRLKAYELLGKWSGMDNKQSTITVKVQPILGGASVISDTRLKVDNTVDKTSPLT